MTLGFTFTATHAIWFFAVLAATGGIVASGFAQMETMRDAMDERAELAASRLHTRLDDASSCHDDPTDTVEASALLRGREPVDVDDVQALVDGLMVTPARVAVEGNETTDVWLPGEVATFYLEGHAVAPTRVLLVAPHGTIAPTVVLACIPGPPASIVVSPASADVVAGGTQQFTATAYDSRGRINATATITWTTTAGSISGTGLLTAQTTAQDGRLVTASWGSVSDNATVDVVPGPVSTVTVTPSPVTVYTRATQSFSAVATDQHGNVVSGATFTWSASRGSVTTAGVYTAPTTPGSDTVTATTSGVSGSASVTVRQDVHVSSLGTYDTSGTPQSSFPSRTVVVAHVTVVDQDGFVVPGVSVSVEFVRPSGGVDATASATTDATGLAKPQHTLPNAPTGSWVARVSAISGGGVTYVPASNTITQVGFTVT